jgi:hypothetical protein
MCFYMRHGISLVSSGLLFRCLEMGHLWAMEQLLRNAVSVVCINKVDSINELSAWMLLWSNQGALLLSSKWN